MLGERRAWLKESAGWVVQTATKRLLSTQDVSWREEGLQAVVQAAFAPSSESGADLEFTPEKLALVILLQEANIKADWETLLRPVFPEPIVLAASDNLPTIVRLLRVSPLRHDVC